MLLSQHAREFGAESVESRIVRRAVQILILSRIDDAERKARRGYGNKRRDEGNAPGDDRHMDVRGTENSAPMP